MGCGKSTIGEQLARMTGRRFTDMDKFIEEQHSMTIPEIFAEKGEHYFREAETEAIRTLSQKGGVVACGGGAVLKKENADIAKENGITVYIEVPFEVCYERISGDTNRPILAANSKESLEEIYNSRVPVYEANSTHKINGNCTPLEAAEAIAAIVSQKSR